MKFKSHHFGKIGVFFLYSKILKKNSALRFLTNNNKIRENDSSNTHDPTYIAAIGLVVE